VDPAERVHQRLAAREEAFSPFAQRAAASRGRARPEQPSPLRTEFQRDRDRIIHSNAFRRLKHKTQVFIAPEGDHYATRLTHTLEVAQIGRTIARALNLNEDLTEAIALGHDLGHTPFGHAGEQALAELLPGGFRHNEQSLRTVELLERRPGESLRGLNLTWEVREGILKHSKPREGVLVTPAVGPEATARLGAQGAMGTLDWAATGWGGWLPSTLEGQIVRLSDSIAYLNHDIADAIRAGLLAEADLPRRVRDAFGAGHASRINAIVTDVVTTSWAASGESEAAGASAVQIEMSAPVLGAFDELREFMFENVYLWEGARSEVGRAQRVIEFLFAHFVDHPEAAARDWVVADDPPWRQAADYIAGMTDRFALETAERLGFDAAAGPRPTGRA
jgi:dGTPase